MLIWLLPLAGRAQVVDDTTRTLYSAKTSFILREADILREKYEGVMVDTTLTGLQQARNWAHDTTFQQDLGNLGTASRPLLWQPNFQLGARLGRNVFDRYTFDAATIPYYDTRSPYMVLRYIQGPRRSGGEQVFELTYSRSLGKNASVGVSYERFASNRVLASATASGLTEHNNVRLFGRYQSEDGRYHLVGNFSTSRHQAVEQGGIWPTTAQGDAASQLFNYADERVWLEYASNRDERDRLHFTQTYRLLGRGLTAFHTFDWRRQLNKFTDTAIPGAGTDSIRYYPRVRLSRINTDDRAEYRQWENTVGVLGRTEIVEYRLYARQRAYTLVTRNSLGTPGIADTGVKQPALADVTGNQLFLGGTAAFHYRAFAIETAGEVLGLAQQRSEGLQSVNEYWFRGQARLGPLTGEFSSSSYSPTLTQQQFSGNHYVWDNDFNNTQVQQLTARVSQTLGNQQLEASGAVANITNLIYYNQVAEPAQLTTAKQLVIAAARYRFHYGKFYTDNQATYTRGGDGEGLRIPALVANAKVYYQGDIIKQALFGQIGLELYYQSRFRGYAYSPSTQQFYVQDGFTMRNFPVLDAYVNFDIKTVSVFLKMAYVNQNLVDGYNGYFTTPFYTALPRRFQFGIRWQFFD